MINERMFSKENDKEDKKDKKEIMPDSHKTKKVKKTGRNNVSTTTRPVMKSRSQTQSISITA